MIFVFGSNLAGIHGAGAAYYAVQHHGAIMKQGKGLQGNSYGLPTKGWKVQTLPLYLVAKYVDDFVYFAKKNPTLQFQVTRVGCGLAGFTDEQIAPLFEGAPKNCYFDEVWRPILGSVRYNYWMTLDGIIVPADLTGYLTALAAENL
jgi:hypothetical protein